MSALDTASLERLARDVSSWPFVITFAQKYQRLLPERVRRVVAAITEGDLDQALDAALSLRVSSAFVGALELVELSHRLEALLRTGDLVAARLRLGPIPEAAQRAECALTTYLSSLAEAS
jgi:HPt (histidine-containing phosphotransfer) domain-containing protein